MRSLVLFLALFASSSAFAQQNRPAWKLTLDERIALRTSPELARERVRQATAQHSIAANSNRDGRVSADLFDGKSHPELFLPHEIYRSLMTLAFLAPARNADRFRRGLMPEVRRVGLPGDFWERLRTVSSVYIADAWAEKDLGAGIHKESGAGRSRAEAGLSLKQLDVCRSRADAIIAARREFGSDTFDRFLYEVIAVNKFHSEEDHLPAADVLRWVERGCR